MSITPRSEVAAHIRFKKDFKLRIPGAGLVLEPQYTFNRRVLLMGDIVATVSPNQHWVDVGQVMSMQTLSDGTPAYLLCLIPRLDERLTFPEMRIPADKIACLFRVLDE